MEPNQTRRFIWCGFLPILFLWEFGGSTPKTRSRGRTLAWLRVGSRDNIPVGVLGGSAPNAKNDLLQVSSTIFKLF